MKSRPRTSSQAFFTAPRNGVAFRPVSSAPRRKPFRRIVVATPASAIAAPIHGSARLTRFDNRRPPHRTS